MGDKWRIEGVKSVCKREREAMEVAVRTQEIQLNEVDFHTTHSCAAIAVIGKRRSGKTTAAIYLTSSCLSPTRRYMVMCGNKDSRSEWSSILPPLCIFEKDVSALIRLRTYQDGKVVEGQPMADKYQVTLIIDDCGADRAFMHSSIILDIFANGRHYGIRVIVLLQYFTQLHPQNRSQLDYAVVLFCNNDNLMRKIHTEFVPQITFGMFKSILSCATENRGALWLDNTMHVQQNIDISNMSYLKIPWSKQTPVDAQSFRDAADRRHASLEGAQLTQNQEKGVVRCERKDNGPVKGPLDLHGYKFALHGDKLVRV